jgi:hypothetical protein
LPFDYLAGSLLITPRPYSSSTVPMRSLIVTARFTAIPVMRVITALDGLLVLHQGTRWNGVAAAPDDLSNLVLIARLWR